MDKNTNTQDDSNTGKTPDPRQVPQKPNQEKESTQEGSFRNATESGRKESFGDDYEVKQEDEISNEEARTQPEKDA